MRVLRRLRDAPATRSADGQPHPSAIGSNGGTRVRPRTRSAPGVARRARRRPGSRPRRCRSTARRARTRLGVDVAGPVAAVVLAELLHVGEEPAARCVVAERVEGEHQLAGLGAGHPGVGVDAADAEARHHEVVPAGRRSGPRPRRRGPRRPGPGSTSPSRTSTCPGTGPGARGARAAAARRPAPTRAAVRPSARPARRRPAARGGRSTTRRAARPGAPSRVGRRPTPAPRRCRRRAAAVDTPSRARAAPSASSRATNAGSRRTSQWCHTATAR